jgi:hypothetical protein
VDNGTKTSSVYPPSEFKSPAFFGSVAKSFRLHKILSELNIAGYYMLGPKNYLQHIRMENMTEEPGLGSVANKLVTGAYCSVELVR